MGHCCCVLHQSASDVWRYGRFRSLYGLIRCTCSRTHTTATSHRRTPPIDRPPHRSSKSLTLQAKLGARRSVMACLITDRSRALPAVIALDRCQTSRNCAGNIGSGTEKSSIDTRAGISRFMTASPHRVRRLSQLRTPPNHQVLLLTLPVAPIMRGKRRPALPNQLRGPVFEDPPIRACCPVRRVPGR